MGKSKEITEKKKEQLLNKITKAWGDLMCASDYASSEFNRVEDAISAYKKAVEQLPTKQS